MRIRAACKGIVHIHHDCGSIMVARLSYNQWFYCNTLDSLLSKGCSVLCQIHSNLRFVLSYIE